MVRHALDSLALTNAPVHDASQIDAGVQIGGGWGVKPSPSSRVSRARGPAHDESSAGRPSCAGPEDDAKNGTTDGRRGNVRSLRRDGGDGGRQKTEWESDRRRWPITRSAWLSAGVAMHDPPYSLAPTGPGRLPQVSRLRQTLRRNCAFYDPSQVAPFLE